MLTYLGIPDSRQWIKDKIGQEHFTEISPDTFISIDDEDGLKLQNSGIGKSFKVKASWDVVNMKLEIPDKFIK